MAYLPDETGYVKKRILLRKDFTGDHLDELSAIVRGENHRSVMAPVTGWATRKAQDPVGPDPGSPKARKGRLPVPIDRETLIALWNSDAPMWAIAKAFGVTDNTIYARARAWDLPRRKYKRRGSVKMGPKHGGP